MQHSSETEIVTGSRLDEGYKAGRGIGFPRLYDLLVLLLTRGRESAYREALLDRAGVQRGQRLLDLGCGTGTLALAAARRMQPDGIVVGVDISEPMVAVAARKAARAGLHIAFHCADVADLPLRDADFDIITITTVLHMMTEARRRLCLDEIRRVLRPGGRLLLVDYAGARAARGHLSSRHGAHGKFDLGELRGMLDTAGFREVEAGPLGWLDLHYLTATKG